LWIAKEQKVELEAFSKLIEKESEDRLAIAAERDEYRRELTSAIKTRKQDPEAFDKSYFWMSDQGMEKMFEEWKNCHRVDNYGCQRSTWGAVEAGMGDELDKSAMQTESGGPLPQLIRKFIELDKKFAAASNSIEKKVRKGIRMARTCAIANMGNGIRPGWRSLMAGSGEAPPRV